MQAKQIASRFMLSIFVRARAALFHDRDTDARRQFANGRWKIDVLVFHDEAEDASADAAPETMKRLALRTDRKRRCLLLMKRAKRLEVCTSAFQWKIGADHL